MIDTEVQSRAASNNASPRVPMAWRKNPGTIEARTESTLLKLLQVLGWFRANLHVLRSLKGHMKGRGAINAITELGNGSLATSADDHRTFTLTPTLTLTLISLTLTLTLNVNLNLSLNQRNLPRYILTC